MVTSTLKIGDRLHQFVLAYSGDMSWKLSIYIICHLQKTQSEATLYSKNVRIEDINEHIQLGSTTNKYASRNDTNHNKRY